MKAILITLPLLLLMTLSGWSQEPRLSDEVVVMEIQIGRDRQLYPVVIGLYEQNAPRTVENFKNLVRRGFYRGLEFHRVFPETLVQTGDPLSKRRDKSRVGTGGPGYTLPAEIGLQHQRGRVAMARLPDDINPGRRSNGSQFFVCLTDLPDYDGEYTVFGEVLEGMEILEEISRLSTDRNNYPTERVRIRSSRLQPRVAAAD